MRPRRPYPVENPPPGLLPARKAFATRTPPSGATPDGRIAQLVEQLTLNQRVLGSSPSAPTTSFHENNQVTAGLPCRACAGVRRIDTAVALAGELLGALAPRMTRGIWRRRRLATRGRPLSLATTGALQPGAYAARRDRTGWMRTGAASAWPARIEQEWRPPLAGSPCAPSGHRARPRQRESCGAADWPARPWLPVQGPPRPPACRARIEAAAARPGSPRRGATC